MRETTPKYDGRHALAASTSQGSLVNDALRYAVDRIPGLFWTARADGRIDFLSQQWLDYTGMTPEQGLDWGWRDVVHPEDLGALEDYWRSIFAAAQPGEAEARLRRGDGAYRWFLMRAVPLYADSGILLQWCGQTIDIDDRKRAEALLAGEKRLLEMVARGRPLTQILEALCRLVETTAEGALCSIVLVDVEHKRMLQDCAPSLPAQYMDELRQFSVTGDSGPCAMASVLNQQVIVADVDTEARWPAWRTLAMQHALRACWSMPIVAQDGTVLGTFAVYSREPGAPTVRDMALIDQFIAMASIAIEQRRREDALRRSEAYLAEAQRLSLTGSFRWRVSTSEISWSDETYRIYGLEPSVPVDFTMVGERVHPEDRAMFGEIKQRAVSDPRDFAMEHRLLLPGGEVKHLQVFANYLRDESGEIEYIGAVRDVTDRKVSDATLHHIREELAHVSRVATLGELTAAIAHEINQPLSGIVTNASTCLRLLAADPPDLETARETARRTIRDGTRAADVIARLRTLFRKQSVVHEAVDLNDATLEVLTLMRTEFEKAEVDVRTELARLPLVDGDRVQIQQVVMNLILNAAEAMNGVAGRRRRLIIRTRAGDAGEEVRLEVEDAGVGFDPETSEQMFNAFYTSKQGGMGMGLSISRSIVERHGGRLWAVPNEGGGATFAFSLPLHRTMTPQPK